MANALIELINAKTNTGAGTSRSIQPRAASKAVVPVQTWMRVKLTGTGAISATILLEASADDSSYSTAATVAVSGTDAVSQTFAVAVDAPFVRANVNAISGTSAAATVLLEFVPPPLV